MRSRLLVAFAVLLSSSAGLARAQDAAPPDVDAGGIVGGNYVRLSAGGLMPIGATGSYRDWNGAKGFAAMWENWGTSGDGIDNVGFGVGATYAAMPFNERQFLASFQTLQGAPATSATAPSASMFTIETDLRYRFSAPVLMPSLILGLGYINFQPSTIHYDAVAGSGTTSQRRKNGGVISLGLGVDRQLMDRYALFAEAMYMYGFTSLGAGLATPAATCTNDGCDVLKNIAAGTVRGGLRVRVGR